MRTKSFPSVALLPIPLHHHHHHYSLFLLSLIIPQPQFYVLLKKNLRQRNQNDSMKSGDPLKGHSRPPFLLPESTGGDNTAKCRGHQGYEVPENPTQAPVERIRRLRAWQPEGMTKLSISINMSIYKAGYNTRSLSPHGLCLLESWVPVRGGRTKGMR